jgi:hypothetical protein
VRQKPVMRATTQEGQGAIRPLFLAIAGALLWLLVTSANSEAQDRVQLGAAAEAGFGRLIIAFPDRLDLPPYRVSFDNNVVAVSFDEPVSVQLTDVAAALPDYVTVARMDPDRRGVRIGLRSAFNINELVAGERLFIDILPTSWLGLPPALPPDIVAGLAERARQAAELAEQKRRIAEAASLKPTVAMRVGRNPTFLRLQFDWSEPTDGKFTLDGTSGSVWFGWPAAVDVSALSADLPPEIVELTAAAGVEGSLVSLSLAEGVTPRFYRLSDTSFVLDVDLDATTGMDAALKRLSEAHEAKDTAAHTTAEPEDTQASDSGDMHSAEAAADLMTPVVPSVTDIGGTIRIAFPFAADVAAAVFRRGDTVWMLFDTPQPIAEPMPGDVLDSVADRFEILPSGKTRLVRLDLATDRLATLGSEGHSWVLSLGDTLLNPTEPIDLERHRSPEGDLAILADLKRPGALHSFVDPEAGDMLEVATIFPPARGVVRTQRFVDFEALHSVHGLVLQPAADSLSVEIENGIARVAAEGGLHLSEPGRQDAADVAQQPSMREGFLDLGAGWERDLEAFVAHREDLVQEASEAEGRHRDQARLELATYLVGNGLGLEALGVLDVLEADLASKELTRRIRLTRAIAETLAYRATDALASLNSPVFAEDVDAHLWRTIARAEANDYAGALIDARSAAAIIDGYPGWVRHRFLFAALRAAVEQGDILMARRTLEQVFFRDLDPEEAALYQLLQGRLSEIEDDPDLALDFYGQVIAAEFRPSRAEAVYRSLRILDSKGQLDPQRATETLAAEALLWRGNALEAQMQTFLAELYFRTGQFRSGFQTVKDTAQHHPENAALSALVAQATSVFEQLYVDGAADRLDTVEALSVYYDFRDLTPPGAKGDEMIRNLARRLVKADLLTQAGDLLEYQIANRLTGAAQSEVAADLAVIRLAERNPESALRALSATRLANLPPSLDRQRRLLEARALIDAGRETLALDILSRLDGQDADLLRVDAHWRTKNYAGAAELLEATYGAGKDRGLDAVARTHLVKAGVGFVLAGDRLGLSRLRAKFGDLMAETESWPMFDFVTQDQVPQNIEFKRIAREVSGLDPLNAFLAAYRERYATDGVTPTRAVPAESV